MAFSDLKLFLQGSQKYSTLASICISGLTKTQRFEEGDRAGQGWKLSCGPRVRGTPHDLLSWVLGLEGLGLRCSIAQPLGKTLRVGTDAPSKTQRRAVLSAPGLLLLPKHEWPRLISRWSPESNPILNGITASSLSSSSSCAVRQMIILLCEGLAPKRTTKQKLRSLHHEQHPVLTDNFASSSLLLLGPTPAKHTSHQLRTRS